MVCIICALAIEYENILKQFCLNREIKIQNDICIAECNMFQCIIVKCGIGKKAASKCLTELLEMYPNIRYVFSVGIAGAISPLLKIGDIALGNRIIDIGINKKIEEMEICSDWNLSKHFIASPGIYWGKIISSDTVIQNEKIKKELYINYHGICVEMESAGIIKICCAKRIKFVAIKIISDYASEYVDTINIRILLQVVNKLGQYIKSITEHFNE